MRNYEKPTLEPIGSASTTIQVVIPDPPSFDGIPGRRNAASLQTALEAD